MLALLDTATDRRSAIFRSDVRPVWVMSAPKPRRAWRSLPPDRSESGRKFNLLVQVREPLRCPSPPELSSVVGNQRACAEGDGGAEGEGGAVTGVSLRRHRRHAATGGGGIADPARGIGTQRLETPATPGFAASQKKFGFDSLQRRPYSARYAVTSAYLAGWVSRAVSACDGPSAALRRGVAARDQARRLPGNRLQGWQAHEGLYPTRQ
jgi:hypothetical protein